VTSAVAGSYLNGPEVVTSSLGDSTPVSATLTVDAADAPGFSKAFSPSTIDPGGISRLTFTIDNTANAIEAADLAFTDAFPAGLVVAGTPNGSTTCGGTFAPGASDVSLAFAGGAVAAGDACAISVDVTSAVAGSYPNTSGALTSNLPDDAPPASATLTVDEAPLIVSMEFSPDTIAQGGVSRLSYDLRNDAAVAATEVSLTDMLPADVVVADVPDASTTCGGGTLTAAAGGDTLAFADGELAAGVSCTISVDVTSAVAGSYSNGPEAVTSSLGDSTPAQATLTVDAAGAPVFSKEFSPSTIDPGGISRLTFTIDNGANAIEAAARLYRRLPGRSCRGRDARRVDDLRRDVRARRVGCLARVHGRRCCGRGKLYDFRRCDLRGCGKLPEHVGRSDVGPAGCRAARFGDADGR